MSEEASEAIRGLDNPVLVEVIRSGQVESWHRGAAVLAKPDGTVLWSVGNIDRPIYPRSAVKSIQALALLESGAADAYGLGPVELAVAQASHSGEPSHITAVRSILESAGLSPDDLECGAHRPSNKAAANALMLNGKKFEAIHNNCSGKHAAMLAAAHHQGMPTKNYIDPDHPIQAQIREIFQDFFGMDTLIDACGVDGCSVPTYAAPLSAIATGMARFVDSHGLLPVRRSAAARLFDAAVAETFLVAGTGRFCTEAMTSLGTRALIKTGAEGVFCAALADRNLGLAVKCDDGASRASEVIVAAMLSELYPDKRREFTEIASSPIFNWRGFETGRMQINRQALAGLAAV